MKKKIWAIMLALTLAITGIGSALPASPVTAASKEVKNLKKLKKKLKKKIKKTYKTETGGTATISEEYCKHNVSVKKKKGKIYFYDTVVYYESGSKYYKYTLQMPMKVGKNKKVTIKIKEIEYLHGDYDNWQKITGKEVTNYKTTIKPATYKYGQRLTFYNAKNKKVNAYADDTVYLSLRCWNKLIKKKAKVSLKSIGFKKFKHYIIFDGNPYDRYPS